MADEPDLDDPASLLAPLVRAALLNSLDRGFDALSGPLLRGDERGVSKLVSRCSRHVIWRTILPDVRLWLADSR
jgi:predicted short-subunit dehydrogenase-like oxidoreductase (DUF2520 family)